MEGWHIRCYMVVWKLCEVHRIAHWRHLGDTRHQGTRKGQWVVFFIRWVSAAIYLGHMMAGHMMQTPQRLYQPEHRGEHMSLSLQWGMSLWSTSVPHP